METAENCPASIDDALRTASSGLEAAGADTAALERGRVAGRIVGALTDDAPLSIAVLAHESLSGDARARDDLRPLIGAQAAELAEQLARLGEFSRGMTWNPDGRLQEPQAETLRKMLLAVVRDPRIVVARIALQLARLRAARDAPAAQREALAAESRAVFAPLANRLGIWRLKWELEDLAFRCLEPDAYRRIASELNERRADRERYIDAMRSTLRQELGAAGIEAEVSGRAKHLYSIHRKMQRKQLQLGQLSDLRALRILCHSVPDCYAALGVVHARWRFIPGEFDDYIATPKDNHYRSIHTAVIGPADRAVEVQIRTRQMHENAELGVAAHWRYKEGGPRDATWERKIEWVRRILDPGETAPSLADARTDERDYIDRVRSELFEDRIYALTPRGEVVDLPRGATPLDFAYHLHSSLGHRCRGAKVNGRIVPLTFKLGNGEIVEIITGKQEAPSRDWLAIDQGYLASARSRAKLRGWFRRHDAGDHDSASPAPLSTPISDPKAAEPSQRPRAARPRFAAGADASSRRGSSPVVVEGVGELPVTLARCCRPVRPQPIVGYLTLGRGVTVHSSACAGLRRMQAGKPDRVLQASWTTADDAPLPVELTAVAYDRRGLVRDLTEVLAAQEVDIDALHTVTDRGDGVARTTMRLRLRDLGQMTRVLRLIAAVPGVISTRRTA